VARGVAAQHYFRRDGSVAYVARAVSFKFLILSF
jgi:hypothetical protein